MGTYHRPAQQYHRRRRLGAPLPQKGGIKNAEHQGFPAFLLVYGIVPNASVA